MRRRTADNTDADIGSVTPLVIGMMLCLLVLAAGITAAGSAFLAGQRTQHLCDGAAATAAGTITGDSPDPAAAADAAAAYLATRGSNATTNLQFDGDTLTLICSTDTPITFGALFGPPPPPHHHRHRPHHLPAMTAARPALAARVLHLVDGDDQTHSRGDRNRPAGPGS